MDTLQSLENDDDKRFYLFSPLVKKSNCQSWNNKFNFWRSNILNHCSKTKKLAFNFKNLPRIMVVNSCLPQCLDVVCSHMLKDGSLQTLSDFELSCDQNWFSWSKKRLFTRPLSWGYNFLFKDPIVSSYKWLFGTEDYNFNLYSSYILKLPEDNLVVPELISSTADAIYNRHTQQISLDFTDNIVNYNFFKNRCRDIVEDESSWDLCVMDMCRRKMCKMVLNADGEKFLVMVDKKKTSSTMHGNEQNIYRLKMMEHKLGKEIGKLEIQINEHKREAKVLLKQGKKTMALTVLKKKRGVDLLMERKYSSLEKISNLLSSIQQTEHNKQVFDVFSSGVEAFKGIQERTGMTEGKVDETMMNVQEAFESCDEINQLISKPIDTADWQDEDLEEELDSILANEDASNHMDGLSDLLDLPPVPSHDPAYSPSANKRSQLSF